MKNRKRIAAGGIVLAILLGSLDRMQSTGGWEEADFTESKTASAHGC